MITIELKILEDVGENGFEYASFDDINKKSIKEQQELLVDNAGKFEIKAGDDKLTMPMDDISYIFDLFIRHLKNEDEVETKGRMWLSEMDTYRLKKVEEDIVIELFLYPDELNISEPTHSIRVNILDFEVALKESAKTFLKFIKSIKVPAPAYEWEALINK